jgi:hypothetical protein
MRTCRYCERDLPDDAFYPYDLAAGRTKCRDCKKSYVQARYRQRCLERKCYYCGRGLADTDKKLCQVCKAARREAWDRKFREPQKLYARRKRLERKLAAFNAYGGAVCRCCGETHVEFLSIDHVDGKGAEHRRQLGKRFASGKNFYIWLKNHDYPPGFQVLCFNCNCARGFFGQCPHERERQSGLRA